MRRRDARAQLVLALLATLCLPLAACADRAGGGDEGADDAAADEGDMGEADDDADTTAPPTDLPSDPLAGLDDNATAWAQAFCDKVVECGCEGAPRPDCVEEVIALQQQAWANAGFPGAATVDEMCLAGRLDGMLDLSCISVEAIYESTDDTLSVALCEVMRGEVPEGEPCEYTPIAEPCELTDAGTYCDPGSGVCEPYAIPAELGEACDGLYNPDLSRICDGNAVCDGPPTGSGECIPLEPGDPCFDGQCPVLSPAGRLRCDSLTDTCQPLAVVGQPCTADFDCTSQRCEQAQCVPSEQAYVCLLAPTYGVL